MYANKFLLTLFHMTDKDFLTNNTQFELHYHCFNKAVQEQIRRDVICKGSILQTKCRPVKQTQNCFLWVTLQRL